jgi:CheY-like chemotaxis protein
MGRVAIIEDSEDTLEVFQAILAENHECTPFKDGEQFLAAFRVGSFDLILLDLIMPGLDGFEILRHIHQKDKELPVVALTAKAEPAERDKALRAGFCDYFVKPIIDVREFLKALDRHMGRCANPPMPE